MESKIALDKKIDDDILICDKILNSTDFDRNAVYEAFNKLLLGYIEIIDGYSSGLNVVSPDCSIITIKDNIKMLRSRLIEFKECDYDNNILHQRQISTKKTPSEISNMFNEVKEYISSLDQLSPLEKSEIMSKLNAIEGICLSQATRRDKWNSLRPYVMWSAGKSVGIALKLFPLFMTIS